MRHLAITHLVVNRYAQAIGRLRGERSMSMWVLRLFGRRVDNRSKASELAAPLIGWLPVTVLGVAVGLVMIALAYSAARAGSGPSDFLYWLGIMVMIVSGIFALLEPTLTRTERLAIVVVLALGFYLVKVLLEPTAFTFLDEFQHLRTTNDILGTGRLFTDNPLLPVSPLYPGLELATVSFSQLTGLPVFYSGVVILGAARLLFGWAVFSFYESVGASSSVAGVASLIYMSNPGFMFFDSQFAYESFALPLGALVLLSVARREEGGQRMGWTAILIAAVAALAVTHHVTALMISAFLLMWAAISVFVRRETQAQSPLGPAFLMLVASVGWAVYVATSAVGYLAPHLVRALTDVLDLVGGALPGRELFRSGAGLDAPVYERIAALGSVALILAALPFGMWSIWTRHRRSAAAVALAAVAALYPASLALRVTPRGAEIAARASEFLYLGVGFVVAVAIIEFRVVGRWTARALLTAAGAVLVAGGLVIGLPQWARMPGPYLVGADPRSIEPEGIRAAEWTLQWLGTDNRILADRTNRLLLGTYGQQHAISSAADRVPVAALYLAPSIGPKELEILRVGRIQFVLIDRRLSSALPIVGVYVERGEVAQGAHLEPVSAEALGKFERPGVGRLFDSGDIQIYDVQSLLQASP
jgi:hypothetical protein